MEYKKWGLSVIALTLTALCILGSTTAIIDPYFHYRKPLEGLEYPIFDERHQSDGFLRHFDYDAVIIGSSMTSNFKTSELNALFGVNAIKASLSAASYKELNNNLQRAFSANPNIKTVFICVDGFSVMQDKDTMAFDASYYPVYLTDDSLLNDVQYLFNKDTFVTGSLNVLLHTLQGKKTTSFDEYANFMDDHTFGKDAVLRHVNKLPAQPELTLSDEIKQQTAENVQQNIISLAQEHPDVQFYCFFPPVSMYYFYTSKQTGLLREEINAYKLASDLILQQDNMKLFAFFEELDIIANPDIYMDVRHYSEDINSQMLVWMSEGSHQLTKENHAAYWDSVYDVFNTYNYDLLF